MIRNYEHIKLDKVIDGDTFDFIVDLGFSVYRKIRVRLAGFNAPERRTIKGDDLTSAVRKLLLDKDVKISTIKDRTGKYGRYLATVYYLDTLDNKWKDLVEWEQEYLHG